MKLKYVILAVAGILNSSTAASHLRQFHGLRAPVSLAKQEKTNLEFPAVDSVETSNKRHLLRQSRNGIFTKDGEGGGIQPKKIEDERDTSHGLRVSPPLIKDREFQCLGEQRVLCDDEEPSLFGRKNKFYLCHHGGGNNFETLCINRREIRNHLMNDPGDYCGECIVEQTQPASTLYHLKVDCDHKRAGGSDETTTTTSSQVCAKFVARHIENQTDDVHEDCVIAPDGCPEFYITLPTTETLMYASVYASGTDALLADAWQLEKGDLLTDASQLNKMDLADAWQLNKDNNNVLRTWWSDGEGARCISDQCDSDCWSNILGAEYAVKGVNLYMSSEIAERYGDAGDWSNVLYEDGHCCELKHQCKSNICTDGICGGSTSSASTIPECSGSDHVPCGNEDGYFVCVMDEDELSTTVCSDDPSLTSHTENEEDYCGQCLGTNNNVCETGSCSAGLSCLNTINGSFRCVNPVAEDFLASGIQEEDLELFHEGVFDLISEDNPSGFISGDVAFAQEITELDSAFVFEASDSIVHLNGTFVPTTDIPIGTVARVYSQLGLQAESLVEASGIFSIILTDIHPGTMPYFLIFSSPTIDEESAKRQLEEANIATIFWCLGQCTDHSSLTFRLRWDKSNSDVDLHVIEPSNNHVYFGSMVGDMGELDVDNMEGFGPEHYTASAVEPGQVYTAYARLYSSSVSVQPITYTLDIYQSSRLLKTHSGLLGDANRESEHFDVTVSAEDDDALCNSCITMPDGTSERKLAYNEDPPCCPVRKLPLWCTKWTCDDDDILESWNMYDMISNYQVQENALSKSKLWFLFVAIFGPHFIGTTGAERVEKSYDALWNVDANFACIKYHMLDLYCMDDFGDGLRPFYLQGVMNLWKSDNDVISRVDGMTLLRDALEEVKTAIGYVSTYVSTTTDFGKARNNNALDIFIGTALSECSHYSHPSRSLKLVDAVYTYGAPSTILDDDLASPGGCIPGIRTFTEEMDEDGKVTNTDFAAHWNMEYGYPHPRMSTLVLRDRNGVNEFELHECVNSEPVQENNGYAFQWLPDEDQDDDIIGHIHGIADHYFPRLQFVPEDKRGPLLEYNSAANCVYEKTAEEATQCLTNYHPTALGHSGWEVIAHVRVGTDNVAVFSNDDVAGLRSCIISFSGSQEIEDYNKFFIWNKGKRSFCGLSGVHEGTRDELRSTLKGNDYRSTIIPALETCGTVACVGHSLGGSVCNLFTACLNTGWEKVKESNDADMWIDYLTLAWEKDNASLSNYFVTTTSTQGSKVAWRLFEKDDTPDTQDDDEVTIKFVHVDDYSDGDTPVNFASDQKEYCLRVFKGEEDEFGPANGSNTSTLSYFDATSDEKVDVPNSQVFIQGTGSQVVKCFTID